MGLWTKKPKQIADAPGATLRPGFLGLPYKEMTDQELVECAHAEGAVESQKQKIRDAKQAEVLVQLQTLTRLLATHMNMQRHLHPCLDVFPEQDEGDKPCEAENGCPRRS